MPVDALHDEFAEWMFEWQKCRDFVGGQRLVHAQGTEYLPMLGGQEREDYEAYKERATVYEATQRTVDLLKGLVFRKEPTVELPPSIEGMDEDITMSGVTLRSFAEMCVEENLTVARGGVMVEYPPQAADENGNPIQLTKAQAEEQNRRPYLIYWKAENIINWKEEMLNGARMLSRVVLLYETNEDDGEDEFIAVTTQRALVLDIFDGKYRQRRYMQEGEGKWPQDGADVFPLMNGAPMGFIPFSILSPEMRGVEVAKPPLLGLVNMNLSHYKTTADFEHGAHYVGLPTPVVSGVTLGSGESLTIGASTAWVFPDKEAKASFLEFTGQGLTALSDSLGDKEERMAKMGASLLAKTKSTAETAETTELNKQSEASMLSTIAQSTSAIIRWALDVMAMWMGDADPKAVFDLNQDFYALPMNPQMLSAMLTAVQGGEMPREDFFRALQRGEIVAADRTLDDWNEGLADNPNGLDAGGDNGGEPSAAGGQ